ncbi:MAG: leucine-rich repeat domain-containing protein [Paludibacteraceae bacterium]|nr:leucine-rich repeat domain-containing protein [Paludibacteraceae bacterium]
MKHIFLVALGTVSAFACSLADAYDAYKRPKHGYETFIVHPTHEAAVMVPYVEVDSRETKTNTGSIVFGKTYRNNQDITEFTVPEYVKSIEESAFENCTNLVSVFLPGSLSAIEPYTFHDCVSLANVRIPVSVRSIGQYAFAGCKSLKSLNIPAKVKTIGRNALPDCDIEVDESNRHFSFSDGVLYNKDKTAIVAFLQSRADEYLVPDNVRSIGDWAFSDHPNLEVVEIPSSVKYIGKGAFFGCNNLEVLIDNRADQVNFDKAAFMGCKSVSFLRAPTDIVK